MELNGDRRRDRALLSLEICGVVVACIVMVLIAETKFPQAFVDDTYIILRYAQHLSSGDGLTWNRGEAPVEGFSNLGWLAMLAAMARCGWELESAARWAGIAAGLATMIVAWCAARALLPPGRKWLAVLVPVHLAMQPLFVRHACNGMETMITALLLVCLCAVWSSGDRFSRSLGYWMLQAGLCFLAFLFRPDAILFGAAGALILLWQERRRQRPIAARLWSWAAPLAILLLLYFLWKLWYFGALVPLPAYQKAQPLRLLGSAMVYFTLGHWVGYVHEVAVLLIIILLACTCPSKACRCAAIWPTLGATVLYGCFFLTVIPIMSFSWRYLFPTYTPLLIVAVPMLSGLLDCLAHAARPAGVPAARWARAAVLATLALYPIGGMPSVREKVKAQGGGYVPFREMGLALADIPGLTLATSEAGVLPYYAGCRVLDVAGINDPFIARHRFLVRNFPEQFVAYVRDGFGLPDLYVEPPREYAYARMENMPAIAAAYEVLQISGPLHGQVFVRKDSPRRSAVIAAIKGVEACRCGAGGIVRPMEVVNW